MLSAVDSGWSNALSVVDSGWINELSDKDSGCSLRLLSAVDSGFSAVDSGWILLALSWQCSTRSLVKLSKTYLYIWIFN